VLDLASLFGYTAKYATISFRLDGEGGEEVTDKLKKRARVLKAMGHPSRLAILDALATGEKCVGELQAVVGSDLSTVSRHLAVLKNAGILEDRKQGANVLYSLRVPCILNFFMCVDAVLGEAPPDPNLVSACQHLSLEDSKTCQKNVLPRKSPERSASRA